MVVIDTRDRCYVKYTKNGFRFFPETICFNHALILKFSCRVDISMTT